MHCIVSLARFWILFVCLSIAAIGTIALPYYVWTITGIGGSVFSVLATVVSGWLIGKYSDRY